MIPAPTDRYPPSSHLRVLAYDLTFSQSERAELHRTHANELLTKGHAYRCFCGPKRLAILAAKRQANGMPIEYDRHCYGIPTAKSDELAEKGETYTIRLKTPDNPPPFVDLIHGLVEYSENAHAHSIGSFEDPILLKSDGMPTYHLANVVDDHYMRITHVLRANEWMPSTPKHMHLYSCFGWAPPAWVHVGLLQDSMYAKLSKRNNSIMINQYRKSGYTAEALNNFVALQGWSHGGEGRSDVMRMEDLIEAFDLEGLTKGNTVVDFGKLDFLQKNHVRQRVRSDPVAGKEELDKCEKIIHALYGKKLENGFPLTREYIHAVFITNLGNYLTPEKFGATTAYFFKRPSFRAETALRSIKNLVKFFRQSGCSVWDLYHGIVEEVEKIPDTSEGWTIDALKVVLNWEQMLDIEVWALRMRLLRVALADGASGPSLADTMWVLGKERCLERMKGIVVAFEKEILVKDGKLVSGKKIKGEEDEDVDEDEDEDMDEDRDMEEKPVKKAVGKAVRKAVKRPGGKMGEENEYMDEDGYMEEKPVRNAAKRSGRKVGENIGGDREERWAGKNASKKVW